MDAQAARLQRQGLTAAGRQNLRAISKNSGKDRNKPRPVLGRSGRPHDFPKGMAAIPARLAGLCVRLD
jgi:hypothetical protein